MDALKEFLNVRNLWKAAAMAVFLCLGAASAGLRGETGPVGFGWSTGGGKDPLVYIVKSWDIQPYQAALEGFLRGLGSDRQRIRIRVLTLGGRQDPGGDFLEDLRESSPDAVVTLGSSATRTLVEGVRDIPIIFSLVLLSSSRDFLERARQEGVPVTGVGMDIPIRLQFLKAAELIPGLKRVGVFYNPRETEAEVRMAARVAEELGLVLIDLPVQSEGDLLGQLEGRWPEMDLLWSVADSTVFTPLSTKAILLETLRRQIPFIGLSPSFVKAGALLSFSCDYGEIGVQSARTTLRVLRGESPVNLPMTYPGDVSFFLNLKTARKIGLEITREILDQAESVYGSSP